MATVSGTQATGTDYSVLNSKTTTSKTDMEEQQDRFMKLLVTQLQNQDPMNPMDSAETTSQMAQINMVTQLSQLNTSLTSMMSSLSSQQTLQAAGLIGKTVLASGSSIGFDGTSAVDFQANIPAGLRGGVVQILDSAGSVVREMDFGAQAFTGYGSFSWDGNKTDGTAASSGNYTVKAYGVDSTGTATSLDTQTWQKVNSVALSGGQTQMVLADGSAVDLSSVAQIR